MSRRIAVDHNELLGGSMRRGWRTTRVNSLKFVNYTTIENAHKERKKTFLFMWLLYAQLQGSRADTGLCLQLWSIRLNCQLMTKLETKHTLQAQVCDGISTKNETGN